MAFFNPARPAYQDDPYPSLARLRAEEPVHWSRELGAWVLTRHADCLRILQDDQAFSSDLARAGGATGAQFAERRAAAPLGNVPVLSNSDAPEHTRLRSVVSRAFTPRALEPMRPFATEFAAQRVGACDGVIDVIGDVAMPLVSAVILGQLGVPRDAQARFRELAASIVAAHSGDPRALSAARRAHGELIAMVESWEAGEAADDTTVLGAILAAGRDGDATTRDEMLMLLINIALSGNGATVYGIGNAVLALASHADAMEAVRTGQADFPAVADELLRFDSPAHIISRIATQDTTLGDRHIHAGDALHVVIGAANRDPDVFSNPDIIDFARRDGPSLTFGYGSHFCLGAPLARIQAEAVISALLGRFGEFRVIAMERQGSLLMRGPGRLVAGAKA